MFLIRENMKNTALYLPAALLTFGLFSCDKKHNLEPPTGAGPAYDTLYYVAGKEQDSFGQIFMFDGRTETNITQDESAYSDVCVNPGHTKILCYRGLPDKTYSRELITMNMDGTDKTVILSFNHAPWFNHHSACWSTDGTKIIFVANGRLAVIGAEGSKPKFISENPYKGNDAMLRYYYGYMDPCISPDGSKIVYVRRPVGDSEEVKSGKLPVETELYVASFNASGDSIYNEQRLTSNGYYYRDRHPGWSADGKLVFSRMTIDSVSSKIISCNANGSNMKVLLEDGNNNNFPCWQKDGKRIYFQSSNSPEFSKSIASVEANGSNRKIILKGESGKDYKNFCAP